MKYKLIYTAIGYIIFAVIFLPILLIKNMFWFGIAFLITVAASYGLGLVVEEIHKHMLQDDSDEDEKQ